MEKKPIINIAIILTSILIAIVMFFNIAVSILAYGQILYEFYPNISVNFLILFPPAIFIYLMIFVRPFCKRKKKFTIVIVTITIAFNITLPLSLSMIEKNLSTFDVNMWRTHPSLRYYMLSDLSIIGENKEDIIHLLGEPDKNENTIFYYNVGNNFPEYTPYYIIFENDIVKKNGRCEYPYNE